MTAIELRDQRPVRPRLTNAAACTDVTISARGRGVLVALAWLPDPWRGSRNDLRRAVAPELGRSAFIHVIRELRDADRIHVVEATDRPRRQCWTLVPLRGIAGGRVAPAGNADNDRTMMR